MSKYSKYLTATEIKMRWEEDIREKSLKFHKKREEDIAPLIKEVTKILEKYFTPP